MKSVILDFCKSELQAKKADISAELVSISESMGSDTKSSAGDKYETGREMMNQEKGKLQSQLANINQQLGILQNIKPEAKISEARFGALVTTTLSKYFLAVSLGKISVDGQEIIAISALTPLAQIMMGKKAGDSIDFNGKKIIIEQIE